MNTASRFTIETAHKQINDTPEFEAASLATVHEQALCDFRRAVGNVVMLGASLREHSSFTRNATDALITLLIAKHRLSGNATHSDTLEILRENRVPEDIRQLLLDRLESTMLRQLAFESEQTTVTRNDGTSQVSAFEKMRTMLHTEN